MPLLLIGKELFHANGVIHEFRPNLKIVRTFEMENTPLCVRLELLEFEKLTDNTGKLNMHVMYESVAHRYRMLKTGIAQRIILTRN